MSNRFLSAKEEIRKALADDFDTPKAMTELLHLISSTHSYMDAKETVIIEILHTIKTFVDRMLVTFGLESHQKKATGSDYQLFESTMNVLSNFRSDMKKLAASEPKTNPLRSQIFAKCDELRDKHLPALSINLEVCAFV